MSRSRNLADLLESTGDVKATHLDNTTSVTVTDNVTSTSTTEALSANQGKELKDLVDGKQASDAQLTDVAGLAVTDGNFIVGNGANFVAESAGTARASLGLTIGTHVQASDSKGADVASASALTVGSGNYFDVTGTTAITSIATVAVGSQIKLHFDGILTLTHHATDLILPSGANITTAAGDEAEFVEYATGDWRCTNYIKADGTGLVSGGAWAVIDTVDFDGTTTIFDYTDLTAYSEVQIIASPEGSLDATADYLRNFTFRTLSGGSTNSVTFIGRSSTSYHLSGATTYTNTKSSIGNVGEEIRWAEVKFGGFSSTIDRDVYFEFKGYGFQNDDMKSYLEVGRSDHATLGIAQDGLRIYQSDTTWRGTIKVIGVSR
jgi:hypothetical protein